MKKTSLALTVLAMFLAILACGGESTPTPAASSLDEKREAEGTPVESVVKLFEINGEATLTTAEYSWEACKTAHFVAAHTDDNGFSVTLINADTDEMTKLFSMHWENHYEELETSLDAGTYYLEIGTAEPQPWMVTAECKEK